MIKRFLLFLGPERARWLFLLLAGTGTASLILNAFVDQYDWVTNVQNLLVLALIIGASFIIGQRLDPMERGRWITILAPAVGAVLLGLTVLPQLFLPLLGAAIGWIAAAMFLFRGRGQMEIQKAVKHLRKDEYEDAVKVMDGLIKVEPHEPTHYRFRAEILRLWGKLDRAKRDYRKMAEVAKTDYLKAVAYNGLAEVELQAGKYDEAREAALEAYRLAPNEWVTSYNLGMIEDRLVNADAAVKYLEEALAVKVPDARHRLLIYFYLTRAYSRLNEREKAAEMVKELRKLRGGLHEWQTILKSAQATTLRDVLEDDIQTAEQLIDGRLDVAAMIEASAG